MKNGASFNVLNNNRCEIGNDEEYIKAVNDYVRIREEKKKKAKIFLLSKPPKRGGMKGMLTNPDNSSDSKKECVVRDSELSIEVLLMKRIGESEVCFLNKKETQILIKSEIPDKETGLKIASQRIKLPFVFTTEWMINKVVDELEVMQNELLTWQQSPWINGELILLLDENNNTKLCGYNLHYSFEKGLEYKKEEHNER